MRLACSALTALACMFVLAHPSRAQDARSAEPFLRQVYAQYKAGGTPIDPTGPDARTIYDPALLALILTDRKAVNGEAGVLDADPICACQDYDIKTIKLSVRSKGAGRAEATASFHNLGQATVVRFDLSSVGGNWRIADIHQKGLGSLRKALADEIASAGK